MTAINNLNLNAPTGPKSSGDTEYLSAGKNTSLMGTAMVTMDSIMLLFTELANAKFEQMSKKTEVSRDAQDMANRVDALLAGLENSKDTVSLPPEVIEYMRANNIEVNGQSIDEFLSGLPKSIPAHLKGQDVPAEWLNQSGGTPLLNKADLTAVKSALESHSGRASDFVQQNQLKLQQLMQNFNTAVTMANSVQSMNAESAKSIAQSIR